MTTTGPMFLRILLGISVAFVCAGTFLLFAERDIAALMPVLFFGACAGVFWLQLRESRQRGSRSWAALEGDTLEVRRGSKTLRSYAILSIMMGLGCGGILFMDAGPVGGVIGLVGLLFFVGCGIVMFVRRSRGGLVLRADAQGIAFEDMPVSTLRWHSLEGVEIIAVYGQKYLAFLTRDGAEISGDAAVVGRVAGRLNRKLGYPDLMVPQIGLDVPVEALGEAILRLQRRYA